MAQDRSKRLPDPPKSLPKALQAGQDASKTLQDGPRGPPEAKNGPQIAPKWLQNLPKRFQRCPKDAPRQFKLRFWGRGGAPRSAGSIRRAPGIYDGGLCGVPNPAPFAFIRPTPLLILPPPAIAITARPSMLL